MCVLFTVMCFSERADPSYCKDRITEGANINKSLVTLGIVISTLGMCNNILTLRGSSAQIPIFGETVFKVCLELE